MLRFEWQQSYTNERVSKNTKFLDFINNSCKNLPILNYRISWQFRVESVRWMFSLQ